MVTVPVMSQGFILLPAIVLGLVIGLYELFAIHADMNFRGSHWLGHGVHAAILGVIAVIITMNTAWFLDITGLAARNIPVISNVHILRIIVGLFMVVKVHSVSAIGGTRLASSAGLAEKWTHSLIIGILIIAAPYVWPFIAPLMPAWLQ